MSEYDNSIPRKQYDWFCNKYDVDDLDCFCEKGSGSVSELSLEPSTEMTQLDYTFDTVHSYRMHVVSVDVLDYDPTPVVGMIPHIRSFLNFTWSYE